MGRCGDVEQPLCRAEPLQRAYGVTLPHHTGVRQHQRRHRVERQAGVPVRADVAQGIHTTLPIHIAQF
jgi:hypothetical protein